MAVLDRLANWLAGDDLAERSIDSFTDHPGLTEQLLAVQGLRAVPWRPLSPREALGVPAVFRAVTLIANTVGSLSIRAYRDGRLMDDPPRLVVRPDPWNTPRDFWRDTAWSLATRGEAIWYVAARTADRRPLTLIGLPVHEVTVDWTERRIEREYRWRGAEIKADRIVHITFAREAGSARGVGPLQLCGAALSVAAEADEWAARFFTDGGAPSVAIKVQDEVTPAEADRILALWNRRAGNTARVLDNSAEIEGVQVNPEQAQLVESRMHASGEVARMFGIPGPLLEYSAAGSSLTYRNIPDLMRQLVDTCLAPGYLEPMEQALSDLLPRSIAARFEVDGLQRADAKERMEIAKAGYEAGIMDRDEARRFIGLEANVETMPIPANTAEPKIPAEVR